MKANSIGTDFGFPRLGIKKKFKWKKMNFTTDLPKRNPLVSYIVASAIRCEKFFPSSASNNSSGGQATNNPLYRMHAVILKLKPYQTPGETPINPFNMEPGEKRPLYVCCHIRRCEEGETDQQQQVANLLPKEQRAKPVTSEDAAAEAQAVRKPKKQSTLKTEEELILESE